LEIFMERRKFSREIRLGALKLVRDRWVTAAQASRDLDVHVKVGAEGGDGSSAGVSRERADEA
jgi:hypothetical protein